ncbi:hypothetical protein IU501_28385 [Nocardia otitidiscaviarum]|uniref:hypothetical protein n=1 Tax=Nocardia otitidiscaviarum TaxID=1823 RepID=UPI0009DFA584|nr:hypothetical protein [Nocardia otitidiscaviarum]MBF6136901.1 hypothetical protein [Nocardia otitidiscaviarum]MBF6485104.1 hypothetical protein [Nocardia otitidiscaviarum]
MEQERFAEAVLGSLRAHGVTDAEYLAEEFSIRHSGDRIVYLGNIFRECAGYEAAERAERIAHFVTAMTSSDEAPEDWAQVRPLLRAVLRPVTYGLDDFDRMSAPLSRPAFPFVNETVVVDLPRTRAYVTLDMVRDWGVEPEAVFAAARDNLAELARPGSPEELELLRFVDDGDAYFGSWPLLPGWLASYAGGEHRPVAFIPDDHTLLVVPDDPELLPAVFEMVEQQYAEAARPISPQGYTLDEYGMVVPYDQAGPEPAPEYARRARSGLAVTEYGIQTRILTAKFEEDLDLEPLSDVEPAMVGAVMFQSTDDGPVTSTIVGEDVEYLLPEADYVHFARMDADGEIDLVCTVPFDTVVQLLGLVPIPGLHPPRFELRRWPDEATLARLHAAAVAL